MAQNLNVKNENFIINFKNLYWCIMFSFLVCWLGSKKKIWTYNSTYFIMINDVIKLWWLIQEIFRIILFSLFSLTIFTIYYIIIVRNHLVSLPPICNYFILSSIFLFLTFLKMLVNYTFSYILSSGSQYITHFWSAKIIQLKNYLLRLETKTDLDVFNMTPRKKNTMWNLINLRNKYIKYVTQLLNICVYICYLVHRITEATLLIIIKEMKKLKREWLKEKETEESET